MAILVSHAMRRYPNNPPSELQFTKFSALSGEDAEIEDKWRSAADQLPEGSALSRSMRYAEPWLYGGGGGGGPAGGLLLAYAPPALVPAPCSCQDYTNPKSSKKQCKKCKANRISLSHANTVRASKYGTVRGYPTCTLAPSIPQVRAGTVRVSSTSRPTILPSVDPYDLMRRSRLSYPETSNPFGTQKHSQKNPNINLTMTRKSILECNVNPYELMASSEHKLKQNSGGSPSKQMTNGICTKSPSGGSATNEYENIEVRRTNDSKIPIKKQVRTRSKSVERETSSPESSKFKSILKKPSTFNETPANLKLSDFSQKSLNSTYSKGTSSSHFYLPMPNASRKKVQFLEENQQICQKKDEKEEILTPILKINGRNPSPEVQENYSAEYEDGDPNLGAQTSNERLNQSPTQETSETSKNLENNFDTITDLQRLDGLGPRQRPKEPPPPPPPPSPPTTNSNGSEPMEKEIKSNRAGTPPPRPYTDGEIQCIMTKNQIDVVSNKRDVSSPQINGFCPENINSQSTPVVPPRKRSNTKKIESIDLENRKNKLVPEIAESSKENSKINGFQNGFQSSNRSSDNQILKENGLEDQVYQKEKYTYQNGYAKEEKGQDSKIGSGTRTPSKEWNKSDYLGMKISQGNISKNIGNYSNGTSNADNSIKEGFQDSKVGSGTPSNDWNKKDYQGKKISPQENASKNIGNIPNGTSNGIPEINGTPSKAAYQGMKISQGNVSKNIGNSTNAIPKTGNNPSGHLNGQTSGKGYDYSNTYQEIDFTSTSGNDYSKSTSGADQNSFSSASMGVSNGDFSFQKSYTYQKFHVDTPEISIVNNFRSQESQMKTEGSGSRTVVQITPTKIIPSTIHRLQIHNESPDSSGQTCFDLMDIPQRKTSILINGDDCYSTVNVSDDVPLYQSSVVVNDSGSSGVEVSYRGTKSSVYITGNFNGDGSYEEKKTLVVVGNHARTPSELSDNSLRADYEEKVVEKKNELKIVEKKNELNSSFKAVPQKPSSDELQKLLNDPVEAVKRNLVPHVCGKADVDGKTNKKKPSLTPNSLVARLLEDPFLGTLTEGLQTDTVAKIIENSLLKLNDIQNSFDDDKETCSENDSCPPYELIEAGSDCYSNHSNRSSVAEDDMSTRSKFYQLLADTAITEIEDHHYECIRPVVDPIYEEIEIPPPLPSNPPPSSIPDDLQIDKQFTTRSIFEGASKYDILSYLVDAKERGIIPEESYTYSFNNSGEVIVEEELEDQISKNSEVFSSRISHLSTVSDSSEDSSLVITTDKGPQKSAEVERNDSGVGSESSKCSRSRYLYSAEQASILCEDCELPVESGDDGPLICRKCSKKRTERKEIITEIVETEEKYSRDLQIILEEFYQPMLVAGLLTPDQLSAIFLNVEELLENSQALAERLRDTVEIAVEQGDEDLLTVNIGKIILEAAPMLHAFETYCIRQGAASLLLASLEKEKELLRIFLRVSQMENTMLRRMNLNSFLMVPVQRVTKYPLLLARLYKVTPIHHSSRELIREAQHKIELHLNHMNSETRDVPSKLWRRISNSTGRRSSSEMDLVNIKLRKIAVDVLEWNHEEAKFALEGRLLFTQPTDNNWRKGRTIKLSTINAMLVTHGKATPNRQQERNAEEGALAFPRQTGVREAALLLVRDKGGRYSLLREPLYLDRCVIATDPAWQSYFEVQELLSKDTFIFKAEDPEMTRTWYRQLQYHAQGMGIWRKRRNALANIMINGMGPRN